MSFIHSVDLPTGQTADAWRVSRIIINMDAQRVEVDATLYANSIAQLASRVPVDTRRFTWPLEDDDSGLSTAANTIAQRIETRLLALLQRENTK